ncbi:hypothetical protein KL930_003516 [Ogataea haglerorum]|uniref:Uncharacterized protein n=1 Tax=Ogataea haglerorum TaxID=1937702 RepID=A0AAN6D6M1_9ASCO|nr:uncharacterized protein KL911_003108 [Ogataea haglerorum]KAG7695518.1 hypothetical protein KL915_002908 [Ogataea haglerorum]KAG7695848.1 hypothetical protein KL951_003373 [Ogataea haglerorum]KAG7705728.1 hypothetical protein KL914_003566 [Ogataea haglerorum]KAG7707254.1 hypothetical protein KL950_002914 [Ogataea haglerorum]KAG7727633.1 hypothetical protein KL933_002567 [Ogataea haglerorum]
MDIAQLNNPVAQEAAVDYSQLYEDLLTKYAKVHADAQKLKNKETRTNRLIKYLELRNNMLIQLLMRAESLGLSGTQSKMSSNQEQEILQSILSQKPYLQNILQPLTQNTGDLDSPELSQLYELLEKNPNSSLLNSDLETVLDLDEGSDRKRKLESATDIS